MNDLYNNLKKYLEQNKIDGLYFDSSNEFLSEYNIPEYNSTFKITGFSGSQSMGLCTQKKIYLFVDTRYHAQADIEVKSDFIEVIKVPLEQSLISAFLNVIPANFKLAFPSKKISKILFEKFKKEIEFKQGKVISLDFDPIELYYSSIGCEIDYNIYKISDDISGKSADKKIKVLMNKYKNSFLIITDLSDIAYFTNLRSFDFPYSSSFPSKLLVSPFGATLYLNNEINSISKLFKTKYFKDFYNDLKKIRNSKVYYQNNSITSFDYSLIENSNEICETDFSKYKSIKNKNEIEHLKKCFNSSDKALIIIEKMINSDKIYSEFEYSKALTESLYNNGASGLSFKPIVASGENSAIIHYSTPSKDKYIKDGDFLLVDFGAYFEGGYATDTTRTFIKGNPSKEQKKVYTTVLKAFLNAYNRNSKQYFDIDKYARKIINKNLKSKYPFSHSTGHGVGINVHEVPPRVSNTSVAKVNIKENTVFSIEPGAYKLGFGGVRLENIVYAKKINGKIKPQTLSKYKFEDKLTDKTLLNSLELKWYKKWQEDYEKSYLY